jgi:hypothetical protein
MTAPQVLPRPESTYQLLLDAASAWPDGVAMQWIPLYRERNLMAKVIHRAPGASAEALLTTAAALVAAVARPAQVRAVVSRGGRPDLAGKVLPRVHQPVLLIVGGKDPAVHHHPGTDRPVPRRTAKTRRRLNRTNQW